MPAGIGSARCAGLAPRAPARARRARALRVARLLGRVRGALLAWSWRALPFLGCRLWLVVLVPGGLAAYPAALALGLAVQRAFIIFPMRCSALALGWM